MKDIEGTSRKIIGKLMETAGRQDCDDHFAIDKWEWPQGVALYALFKRWRATGDETALLFLRDWYSRASLRPSPPRNVNTCAPFLALAFLAEADGDDEKLAACDSWAEWIMERMPRTEEGGLQHVTSHLVNEGELWADTLYMTVLFLAKMGELRGNRAYLDEAAYQFLLHIKHLSGGATGLWFHGWSFVRGDHFGGVRWARGNAWFAAGAPDFLEISGLGGAAGRMIVQALSAQFRALAALQDESGLWRTVLDDKDSYPETSASAAIAYGMLKSRRLGLLDADLDAVAGVAAGRAVRGVLSQVGDDGTVRGVSHGTAVGLDRAHYLAIPRLPTAYGQGLAFMMLGEAAAAAATAAADLPKNGGAA